MLLARSGPCSHAAMKKELLCDANEFDGGVNCARHKAASSLGVNSAAIAIYKLLFSTGWRVMRFFPVTH